MAQSANEVKKVITGWMDDMVGNIHTAMPGKIISYDAGMGRADVQPVGQYKLEDGRGLPYPVIHGARHLPNRLRRPGRCDIPPAGRRWLPACVR